MTSVLPLRLETSTPVAELAGVRKRYGRDVALDGAELVVPEGAVYALVGQNGAGKTTTMRLLLDLVRPDSGRVELFGEPASGSGARVRSRIGYIPEGEGLGYGWMRVGRLLRHHSVYFPTWDGSYAERLVRDLEISPDRRYGALSKGQRRRVQLVMALAHRPSVLLLDEPTDGLDPVMRDRVCELLAEHLADSPATVLVSTHRVYELEGLIDHVGVMSEGRVVVQSRADELRAGLRRYRVRFGDDGAAEVRLNGAVLSRRGGAREADWTVWGEESSVAAAFVEAGGTVADVESLTLDEATLEILRTEA